MRLELYPFCRDFQYTGSVITRKQLVQWIWEDRRMLKKQITFIPVFYKIFNELLVNAADNKQRDPTMNSVKVNIDVANNLITIWNNSDCVPVDLGLFNYLRDSKNFVFDSPESIRIKGPSESIFLTELTIETAEANHDKRYKQVFTDNEFELSIDKCGSSQNWTMVSFKPDLAKFGMDRLEDDILGLMKRRVVDLAGCMAGKGVKVELDGELIPLKTFEDYVKLYPRMDTFSLYEKVNDRLEISLGISDGRFEQVSFVNNFATMKGGSHVDYITTQITSYLAKLLNLEPNYIKSCLCVFVNALIDTPNFASQTKENLMNNKGSLGSTFKLTPQFLEKIANSVLLYVGSKQNTADEVFNFKQNENFNESDGKRKGDLNIPKLIDADFAGTDNSEDCTLILTQGDSAKEFAMRGLSFMTIDYYGVFSVKAKLLHLKEASREKLQENADLQNIKMILGLEDGRTYENVKELRYGRLIIMPALDRNGSYFTGLLINFLHLFWPSLLKVPNFVSEFIRPVVKASNKESKEVLLFYTIPEYQASKIDLANYEIEYCKGPGTIEPEELAKYFADLDNYKAFLWADDEDGYAIELAFSNMKIGEREDWLRAHQAGAYIHSKGKQIRYRDFINKELIRFSNQRSIPSMVDGLKPVQRKILYFAFKEHIIEEIGVSQFSAYVWWHSAYRHGVPSLVDTIISMAQNFVGSNNINLLQPNGNFGTRLMGGKDHAGGRCTFTQLSPITQYLFHKADEHLLNYLNGDGPAWFIPIIPMVLVNGSEGSGTRWSSFIPSYNPRDIIANIKHLMNDETMVPMTPWYKGFKGTIKKKTTSVYTTTGIMKKYQENAVTITELPVRSWTREYKEFLQAGQDGKDKTPFIKSYTAHNYDKTVHFRIVMTEDQTDATYEELLEKFELTTTLSTANMYLFDANGVLKKYDTPEQILEDYFGTRLKFYGKRRIAQLWELKKASLKLENKVRFIHSLLSEEIDLVSVDSDEMWAKLKAKGLKKESEVEEEVAKDLKKELEVEEEVGKGLKKEPQGNANKTDPKTEYDYLVSIDIRSLSFEKVKELEQEIETKKKEIDALTKANSKSLWRRDLDALDHQLLLDGNYPSAKSSLEIAEEYPKKKARSAETCPLLQSANTKKPKR